MLTVSAPCIITARLLPGLRIGNGSVSIEYGGITTDNRRQYMYHIDIPGYSYSGGDLSSGVGGGSLQSGLSSLLSFLGAFAESVVQFDGHGDEGEHVDLFPPKLREWAIQNSDEISMLEAEIGESETPIIEEN